MVIGILGMILGMMIFFGGLYYLIKERQDKESRKIYTIMSIIGGIVFVVMLFWAINCL